MRVYLSGPITGLPDRNKASFDRAEHLMLAHTEHVIVNPLKACNDLEEGATWEQYLRKDIALLLNCDGIALLDGHERSRGSRLELTVASSIGLDVRLLHEWIGEVNAPHL